jgi:hypothetical protein
VLVIREITAIITANTGDSRSVWAVLSDAIPEMKVAQRYFACNPRYLIARTSVFTSLASAVSDDTSVTSAVRIARDPRASCARRFPAFAESKCHNCLSNRVVFSIPANPTLFLLRLAG